MSELSLAIFIPAVDPGFDEAGNIIPGSFEQMMLFILLINVLLNFPIDLLSSAALYRIARMQDLRCAWLAWIPCGSLWVMGCIADNYQEERKGRTGFLRWLLLLHIVFTLLLWFLVASPSLCAVALKALAGQYLLSTVALGVLGIVSVYVALLRVYRSSMLVSSEAYTILGVIFSVPTPFLLWKTAREMWVIHSLLRKQ